MPVFLFSEGMCIRAVFTKFGEGGGRKESLIYDGSCPYRHQIHCTFFRIASFTRMQYMNKVLDASRAVPKQLFSQKVTPSPRARTHTFLHSCCLYTDFSKHLTSNIPLSAQLARRAYRVLAKCYSELGLPESASLHQLQSD